MSSMIAQDWTTVLTAINRIEIQAMLEVPDRELGHVRSWMKHLREVIASGAPREAFVEAVEQVQCWTTDRVWDLRYLTWLDERLCGLRALVETAEERRERRELAHRIAASMEAAR